MRPIAAFPLSIALFLCTVIGAALPARAQEGTRAILDVRVNTVDNGMYTVFVTASDVQITRADLNALGLAKVAHAHGAATGPYVSLEGLKPGLTWRIDMKDLQLEITVDPKLLGTASFNVKSGIPVPVTRTKSAFINYGLLVGSALGSNVTAQLGSTLGQGVASATFNNVSGNYRLTNINWTADNERTLRRVVIGDAYADLGDLSGGGVVRGVTVERNFGLNPFVNRFVAHALRGYVATPSTADVYVNGVLVQQLQLPPGAFNLYNLPLVNGANNAQIVLRDAFGNVQTISQTFYEGLELLNKGQTDYTYMAGDPQDGLGDSIGPSGAAGTYNLGLSDDVTAGVRMQVTGKLFNAGPTLAIATRAGEFDFLGFTSSSAGVSGRAAEALYSFSNRAFSLNLGLQLESASYATMFQAPLYDRPLSSLTAGFGIPIGRQLVAFNVTHAYDRDQGEENGFGASTVFPIGQRLTLDLNYQRNQFARGGSATDIFTTLNFPIGGGGFAGITSDASTSGNSVNFNASRTASPDMAFGYSANVRTGATPQSQYLMQWDAPFGIYTAQRSTFSGRSSQYFNAAGSIVFVDKRVLFSRPLQGGYLVVDASGPAGVPVYVNGRDMGTTRKSGLLVAPEVQEYFPNTVQLDLSHQTLSEQYSVSEKQVTAAYYTAALVKFQGRRVQAFVGSILVVEKALTMVPKYGTLTIDLGGGAIATSIVGEGGEFYLENVASGEHPASVRYAGASCAFTLDIPDTTSTYVRLGEEKCTHVTSQP